ncbi:asparaginase [Piscinibacterium candidicorallinum]|uniref:Asparaginase n=1 Tax=Piscinibacterium candidicorallinum TaxID=1793872 RepID=A0ABV7H9Y0_9BURK
MSLTPLIQTHRGGTPECAFFGAVAVTDSTGQVLASSGDPYFVTFTRSTLKALQALPFVAAGGVRKLGWGDEELALMCASHNGEDAHVAVVDRMLQSAGMQVRQLQCGCHVPYRFNDQPAPAGFAYDERHHNCSGKHAGMLAWCAVNGADPGLYIEPDSPLQRAIRRDVARAVRMEESQLRMGIDGCSAPNYAMPLSALATGYARLAHGAADGEFGEAFEALGQAMSAHPLLVSGTGRNDEAFMRIGRGDWVTKVGADGVQALGSRSRGEAIAIKIGDGSKIALYAAAVEAMAQRGWLDAAQAEALEPWRAREIRNIRGNVVGERRAVFKLQAA